MFLRPLLVIGLCVMEASFVRLGPPFDFRQHCEMKHSSGKFSARCNGSAFHFHTKDLFLDSRSTRGMSEMELFLFENVTLDNSVEVEKISVTNVKKLYFVFKNSITKNLTIDSVDEVTIVQESPEEKGWAHFMSLTNVKKLYLISDRRFLWQVSTVQLNKIQDVDLEESLLSIYALSASIEDININLEGKASLMISTNSGRISKSNLYIHDKGFFNLSADHFDITDSKITIDFGAINLVNSKEVTFSNCSLNEFGAESIIVFNTKDVKLLENDVFTRDATGFLSLHSERVKLVGNKFGCNDCGVAKKLLSSDLGEVGDVNYCYVGCKLTLNYFHQMLNKKCFCDDSEQVVSHELLCAVYNSEEHGNETVTDVDILRWIILVTIVLVLIVSLVLCICHKDNRRKVNLVARATFLPQDLVGEQQQTEHQGIVFTNDSYEDNGHYYEPVGRSRLNQDICLTHTR